ncbi:hypothetical protein JCM3774_001638 [Rhodotorula dairenensis]
MAPVPVQTVLSLSSSPIPSTSLVSLLPFTLAHDGPAPISTFFHPRPYHTAGPAATAAAEDEGRSTLTEHRQAAFRGRRVVSSTLVLPDGYTGLVYSTTVPLPPSAHDAGDNAFGANDEAREERAAKRAKRAAASVAALDAASPTQDQEAAADDSSAGMPRRSPRKSSLAAASTRARERAVRAAKEKARRRHASSSSGTDAAAAAAHSKLGTVQAKRFSLDSDEDEVGEVVKDAKDTAVIEEVEATAMTAETVTPAERLDVNTVSVPEPGAESAPLTVFPTPGPVVVETSSEDLVSDSVSVSVSDENETATAATAAACAVPPAPPLRTASTASIASSSIITSAPRSPSPPPLAPQSTSIAKEATPNSLPSPSVKDDKEEEEEAGAQEEPVMLARDEKRLVPSLTFDRIEVWNPDWPLAGGKVTEDDEVGRAVVEWIGLAAKVKPAHRAPLPLYRRFGRAEIRLRSKRAPALSD